MCHHCTINESSLHQWWVVPLIVITATMSHQYITDKWPFHRLPLVITAMKLYPKINKWNFPIGNNIFSQITYFTIPRFTSRRRLFWLKIDSLEWISIYKLCTKMVPKRLTPEGQRGQSLILYTKLQNSFGGKKSFNVTTKRPKKS